MNIQLRAEGSTVPYGFSVTSTRSHRLHVWFRESINETEDRILHLAVPIDKPLRNYLKELAVEDKRLRKEVGRCKEEVFDGWEDSDRCLLDQGHNANDDPLLRRFSSNKEE